MDGYVVFSFPAIKTIINKDGIEKKQQVGMPLWKNITSTTIQKGHSAFAVITGHLSGITVFDFDVKETYYKILEQVPELKGCKTIETKKGFHLYFNYDKSILSTTNCFEDYEGVDIRNDTSIVYCPPTTYKLKDGSIVEYKDLGGEVMPVPDFFKSKIKQNIIVKKERKVKETKVSESVKDETYTFIKNIIKEGLLSHLSTDYQSWMKVGMALKDINAFDLFLLFSKTSKNFDEKGCLDAWNNFKPNQISIGSIFYWAKEKDKMTYYSLIERKMPMNNEYEISLVANRIIDNVVRIKDDFYLYDGYWKKVSKDDLRASVIKELRTYVMSSLTILTKQVDLENYDEILTRLRNILNTQINKTSSQKNIIDQYCINLSQSQIEMDSLKPYYFCFTNCAFDLRTNQKVETKREDFITQTTGYEYIEPTDEMVEEVARLIESIFPNSEKRRFYMSVLRTGMIGLPIENLVFATGSGGNGKGLLNDNFSIMLGDDYYYKGDKKTLTEPIKQGANPEVANINKKRTVVFSEPEQNSKIQVGTMKELTGGGVINARGLYEKDTRCHLLLTPIMEYNLTAKPTLSGDIDDAITRRLRVCEFDQKFKMRKDGILEDGCQEANPYYKTPEFKMNYRCAFFKYLLRYNDTELYEPEIIKQETMRYFFGADDFIGWFEENYELTEDETDFVLLKDMLDLYKSDMKGRDKKTMTRKAFQDMFEGNIKFKKLNLYCDRKKINNIDHRSIFIKMKKLE